MSSPSTEAKAPPAGPTEPLPKYVQLPELSPDIWRVIASTLSVSDRTNLSQSCKQFHQAIVADEVFEHFCLRKYGNSSPPASVVQGISWPNLYRRSCAIRLPPSTVRNVPRFDCRARILATVADSIVLFFQNEGKIRGFPVGWERDVSDLCDDPEEVIACCVQVPSLGLGFLQSKAGGTGFVDQEFWSKFKTIDAVSGELLHEIEIPVGRKGLTHARMEYCVCYPKAIYLAGRNGQFLAYFVDGGDVLRVVDRLTGEEVSNYSVTDGAFGRLFRAVFPETGGFTVAGVVYVNDVVGGTGKRKCAILLFDEDPEAMNEFFIDDGEELIDVVKGHLPKVLAYRVTKDRKTLTVWRVEVSCQEEQQSDVLVDMERRWPIRIATVDDGSLVMASEEFSMSPNGRQIFIVPKGIRSNAGVDLARRVFRATFSPDGTMASTESVLQGFDPPETGWSWTAICMENRMLVVCAQSAGLIALFNLEHGERLWSLECSEPLWDMALVGEHSLVGIGANSGQIYAWHFDAFCKKPQKMRCEESWAVGKCVPLFPNENDSEGSSSSESPKEEAATLVEKDSE